MAEGVAAAIARYVLDETDADLKRLLKISELVVEFVRIAMQRAAMISRLPAAFSAVRRVSDNIQIAQPTSW